MMRLPPTFLFLSILLLSFGARGGSLTPELEEALAQLGPGDFVDVIVRCTDKVDLGAFRDEDISVRREKLIEALQNSADACERSLRGALTDTPAEPVVLWTINGIAATVPVALAEQLARRPGVDVVDLDEEVIAPAGSTSSTSTAEWNVDAVRAPELWGLGYDGAGVVIATMDTGVDPYHPDVGPKWRGGSNSWFDPNGQHASPYDADGHGTRVMGLIVGGDAGGTAIGVAPGAQWIAVKIFKDNGRSQLSKIHEGFQWLLDPDGNPSVDDAPDIVNNSWYLQNTLDQCDWEFADDIAVLKVAEIAVVFAAGNTGPGDYTSVSPSNDPQSVAVGAVDPGWNVGGFSARGPSACGGGTYPGISAPGANVWTADRTFGGVLPDSYVSVTGTSFSAPHVAGGLALLMNAMEMEGTPITISLLETALAQGAADLGDSGPDNAYGAGLLDAVEAYSWLVLNAGGPQPGQLQLDASTYGVAENATSLTVTVTRTGGSAGTVTVDYATIDGTASSGEDYEAASGTLTFLGGEVSRSFTVTILDDTLVEGDEQFTVSLGNPMGGASLGSPDTSTVTITDNDSPPVPGDLAFDAASYDVTESAGSITVTVIRTGGSDGTVSVDYSTADGTATSPEDYSAAAGTLVFVDGDTTESFTIAIVNDALDEPDEDLTILLSNPTGGAALGTPGNASLTIIDDDTPSNDVDRDGYSVPSDCNDNDPSIHPGAAETKHDGIDQDCNGYDLTIDIVRAEYTPKGDKLIVEATSALDDAANLQVVGYGDMRWSKKDGRWTISVPGVNGNPGSVTVTGVEGSESSTVN